MYINNNVIDNRYVLLEKIGEGLTGVIYRANDLSNQQERAILILNQNHFSYKIEDYIRFHHEITTITKLSHPNIIQVYEAINKKNTHYIVMEYFYSGSLSRVLHEGKIFTIEETMLIITQISKALDYIHAHGLIHRDLEPKNILISKKGNSVDFDNIKIKNSGLNHIQEHNELKNKENIITSFNYMAPEQTGMFGINPDKRSNLYSLGIIFYQLLTNQLPFQNNSIHSIIHQHIAKQPRPLRQLNINIPKTLELIVLKLLEKEPEKRYQSARGLLFDIEKYKKGDYNFTPGLHDDQVKLTIKTKLCGRDKELQQLKSMYENACNGKGICCLIGGKAGTGKTRLIEELRDFIYNKGGTFILGKCFPGSDKEPYNPLIESLNIYLNKFDAYPDEIKQNIKSTIHEHIGELGSIILRTKPLLKEIVDHTSAMVELSPENEKNRHLMVMRNFIYGLATVEKGLVLFIDDLHWSDQASLELLFELIVDIHKIPLFIIGTYRNDEITPGHGLGKIINRPICDAHKIKHMNIAPFGQVSHAKFISLLLRDNKNESSEIADFIFNKSQGNPFFAIEIINQLVHEKALYYNENNKWSIDHKILTNIKIPGTILDILIKRISLLTIAETEILTLAAMIEKNFTIDFLIQLCKDMYNKEIVMQTISKTTGLQLLDRDAYDFEKISFAHDKIKEAFYATCNDEHRKKLHLKIGIALETMHKSEIDQNINECRALFEMASHFIECGEQEKILRYAYPAAIKAKESYAHKEAINYLLWNKKCLEATGKKNSEEWTKTNEAIGEIYLLIGKNTEAIDIFNSILPLFKANIEKAYIYKQISQAYFKKGDFNNCEKYSSEGLKLIGEKLPINKTPVLLNIAKELFSHITYLILPEFIFQKKFNKKAEKDKLIVLFYYSLNWSYGITNTLKLVRSILRMLNISMKRIGISKELAMSISGYGILCSSIPLFQRAIKYHTKALNIRKQIHDEWGIAQSLQFMGLCYQWSGEHHKSNDFFEKSNNIFTKICDTREMVLSLSGIGLNYYYLSDYANAKIFTDKCSDIAINAHDSSGICNCYAIYMMSFLEQGDFENAENTGREFLDLAYQENILFSYFTACMCFGMLYLEKEDNKKALEYANKARALNEKNNFLSNYACFLYLIEAEIYISDYIANKSNNNKENKSALFSIKKTCETALKKTKPWPTYYGHALRIMAIYYSLINKNKRAHDLFSRSIHLCLKTGRMNEAAKGYYEYGIFLNNINQKDKAVENWVLAYNTFKKIGAQPYVNKVGDLLGIHTDSENPILRYVRSLQDHQASSSLLELNKFITSNPDIETLLDKALTIILELSSAEKGHFLLKRAGINRLYIAASKNINRDSDSDHFSESIAYDAMDIGKPVITDIEKDLNNRSKSILCLPIKYNNDTKGICYLEKLLAKFCYPRENMEILNAVMTQAYISIEMNRYQNKSKKIGTNNKKFNSMCAKNDLSKREQEILLLVINGRTNREIADELAISHNTVKVHMVNIYQKLKIKDRDKLIQFFVDE